MVQEEHTVLIIVLCVLERDMMSEDVSVGGPSMAGGCSLCGGTGVVRSKCIYCGGSGRQEYAECTRCKGSLGNTELCPTCSGNGYVSKSRLVFD